MRHGALLGALLGGKATCLGSRGQATRDLGDNIADREAADHKAGHNNAQQNHVAHNNAQVGSQDAGDAAAHVAAGLDSHHVCDKRVGRGRRDGLVERDHGENRHDDQDKARRHVTRDGAVVGREEGHGKDEKGNGHQHRTGAEAQGKQMPHGAGHGSRGRSHDRDEHGDGQNRQDNADDVALRGG